MSGFLLQCCPPLGVAKKAMAENGEVVNGNATLERGVPRENPAREEHPCNASH
jgi:hypothetical protein